MFGQNDIVRAVAYDGHYRVQDVFRTIQGEGPLVGLPAVFIRLWGCNLRCYFCDTDFTTGTWRPSLDELVAHVDSIRVKSRCIVITGGEPLIQEIYPLIHELVKTCGLRVQIETAGTVWPSSLDNPVVKVLVDNGVLMFVCSPKTGRVAPEIERYCRDWKYIIGSETHVDELDGLPIMSTQRAGQHVRLYRPPFDDARHTVWVQPMDVHLVQQDLDPETKVMRMVSHSRDDAASQAAIDTAAGISMSYGYRLSLQTHKVLGLP